MARRRLNPDDVLAARGYNAQVLWPRYEPGGGVNSGSEPPVRPSNTLQSNQSNLVLTRYNPLDSNYDDLIELRPVTEDTSPHYRLTRNPSEDELLLQHLAEMEREEAEREESEINKRRVKMAKPKQLVPIVTASGQLRYVTQKQYDLMRPYMKQKRSNPKRAEKAAAREAAMLAWQRPIRDLEELHHKMRVEKAAASEAAMRASLQRSTSKRAEEVSAREAAMLAASRPRSNPRREIGDSMQARRKSKSCSGAQINPGDSITKTEAGWERTDLL